MICRCGSLISCCKGMRCINNQCVVLCIGAGEECGAEDDNRRCCGSSLCKDGVCAKME